MHIAHGLIGHLDVKKTPVGIDGIISAVYTLECLIARTEAVEVVTTNLINSQAVTDIFYRNESFRVENNI